MQALATRYDPIFEVTGVPAAEILERCARARTLPGGGTPADLVSGTTAQPRKPWRLSQFSQGSNLEFVQLAHIALLNRPATPKEVTKRLRQLSSGKTRLGIVTSLMQSAESRNQDIKLRGVILLTLRKYALRGSKSSDKKPTAANAGIIRLPDTLVAKSPLIRELSEVLKTIPKIGRMRREIKKLREEVRQLRARLDQ